MNFNICTTYSNLRTDTLGYPVFILKTPSGRGQSGPEVCGVRRVVQPQRPQKGLGQLPFPGDGQRHSLGRPGTVL